MKGTPRHCRGEFRASAPKEAPSKTPSACEHRESTFPLRLGKRELTFHFSSMFTLEENNLMLNGYSPGVCRGWGRGEVAEGRGDGSVVRMCECLEWCVCMCVVCV